MKKTLIVTAAVDGKQPGHKEYHCDSCGYEVLASVNAKDPHCPYCSNTLGDGLPVKKSAEFTASTSNMEKVKCLSCGSDLNFGNTDKTADELVLQSYCMVCGSEDLSNPDSEEEAEDVVEEVEELDGGETCEAGAETEEEDDVEDALDGTTDEELSAEGLQWTAIDDEENGENGTLLACSRVSGQPMFVFKKNMAPVEMQTMFASAMFVSAFNQIAAQTSLTGAVRQFGGSSFKTKEVLNTLDMEALALSRLEATALPKLVDCMQLAVEGGIKGVYQDVAATIQNTFVTELQAAGIPKDRAQVAVSNAFASHGSDMFASFVAKAMELYNKPEAVYAEAKTMVKAAAGAGFTEYDSEQAKVRAVLNLNMVVLTASAKSNVFDSKSAKEVAKILF